MKININVFKNNRHVIFQLGEKTILQIKLVLMNTFFHNLSEPVYKMI